jgi:hypothetical protein
MLFFYVPKTKNLLKSLILKTFRAMWQQYWKNFWKMLQMFEYVWCQKIHSLKVTSLFKLVTVILFTESVQVFNFQFLYMLNLVWNGGERRGKLQRNKKKYIMYVLDLSLPIFAILDCKIQGDQKVTQPILKYILMIAVQYSLTGLINTQYHCDYTRAHTGYIML